MYENLIQPPPLSNSHNHFSVRLATIPVDERVVYIDSVCAALIDSRFGPGRSTPVVIKLSDPPERGDAVFCEMTIEGTVPSYVIVPDSEMARRYAADIIRQELVRLCFLANEAHVQTRSPSTQGRGSP